MFNATGLTSQQVTNNVITILQRIRSDLEAAQDLYGWSAGLSNAELVAIGFSSADASAIQSAIADANALAQIYDTGLPPGTYPQPPSALVYSASQRRVIGPQ